MPLPCPLLVASGTSHGPISAFGREGSGTPVMDSAEKFEMFGRLMAQIHQLPTKWYDEWKEKVCVSQPFMRNCPPGHWLWILASSKLPWFEGLLPQAVTRLVSSENYLFEPQTSAGRRIVTVHGDLHSMNVLQLDERIIAIDFDATTVAHAIHDLGYVMASMDGRWHGWMGDLSNEALLERKRAFIVAYLSEMGDPATAADVDALFLDAQLTVHMPVWPGFNTLPDFKQGSEEDQKILTVSSRDNWALTFEHVDNKLICSSLPEPMGIGGRKAEFYGDTIVCRTVLVPVSEAFEVMQVDGRLQSIIDDRRFMLIVAAEEQAEGKQVMWLSNQDIIKTSSKWDDKKGEGTFCLGENGTITACAFQHLKLTNCIISDAELIERMNSKIASLESYVGAVRADATLQDSLFLKGHQVAYTEWLKVKADWL